MNEAGHKAATVLNQAIADLTTIAFYYLLLIGELLSKETETKQSVRCNSK